MDSIFDTVDAKDWAAAEKLFDPTVTADFTSLSGGEPATITNVELVDGWRPGLHPGKKSFHLVGHHRIRVDGDTATVAVKGYAYNVLDDDLGGGMWEVWGAYDIPPEVPAVRDRPADQPHGRQLPGSLAIVSRTAGTISLAQRARASDAGASSVLG